MNKDVQNANDNNNIKIIYIIIIIIIIIFFFIPLVVKIPGVKRKKLKTDVSSLEWSEV